MRLAIVWTILLKELTETLRDRRTIVRVFLLPVLLYPLLVLGFSKFEGSESDAREARASKIAVWGDAPEDVLEALRSSEKLDPRPGAPDAVREGLASGALTPPREPAASAPKGARTGRRGVDPGWTEPENPVLEAARAVIAARQVDAVVVIWPGYRAAIAARAEGEASIFLNSVRADSAKARDRLETALGAHRARVIEARQRELGLPEGFSSGVALRTRNVAMERRRVGHILGGVLPFLLIGMSLLGALYPAIDLTAGEKERGTMQTLLCAPVRPVEIIFGKFLAVWTIALLMALANLVSLAATITRALPGDVNIGASAYAITFVMLVPVTFLVSALFLSLAVFAKDFKDGQNVLIPVYMPIYLLAGIAMMPGVELDAFTALAPIVNVALLIKASLLSEAAPDLVFLTIGSSILYAAIALSFAARVFEREQVLLGGGSPIRALFHFERRAGGTPTAALSITAVGAILVATFYAGAMLARWDKLAAVFGVQIGFFLIPALGLAAALGFSARSTFALRSPGARGPIAAVLLGVSGGAAIGSAAQYLIPVPERFARALTDTLLLDGQPLWVLLAALALTPAICEELLFRGLLFSGLRRLGPIAAVVLSALIFGFAHGSIYRLLPTFGLGLVLGYARLRTGSIVPGMIVHALNNALALTLLHEKPSWAGSLIDGSALPPAVTAGAAAVLLGGLLLLRSARPPEESAAERLGAGPEILHDAPRKEVAP